MKKLTLATVSGIALAISGTVLAPARSVYAQVGWNFSYSPIGNNNPVQGGSGGITTQDLSLGGFYIITDIGGTAEGGSPILQPPGSFANNDNRVFDPPFPQLTENGFTFGTYTSVTYYNIRVDFSTRGYLFQFSDDLNNSYPVTFTATRLQTPQPEPVPEPGNSLSILAMGGAMGGIMLWRALKRAWERNRFG